ncbi:hypothetical protein AQ725_18780 [Burkholderia pseudomallei]|nr:hypothetical protein AQ718_09280 [Burkholderia pseudomallei]OMR41173.1 hypothetical protein AQ725_18780 [Burkholderia pseudomallei]OMT57154.1 hypothetical protein AQ760_07650 [Burkholderia pseudomallei]OMZ32103.1 hypothetical protein AQ860_19270 [Burkholderia pseudomallei]OMZ32609.1 hypothetical protein AQ859_16480 [Burkholderia pseudomallei]
MQICGHSNKLEQLGDSLVDFLERRLGLLNISTSPMMSCKWIDIFLLEELVIVSASRQRQEFI